MSSTASLRSSSSASVAPSSLESVSSTLFLLLDNLVSEKSLSAEKCQRLKQSYSSLHEGYMLVNEHELELLDSVVEYEDGVRRERERLRETTEATDSDKKLIEELKAEYVEADTKIKEIEERLRLLNFETHDLRANENILKAEYESRLAEEEAAFRPQIEKLEQGIKGLKQEISANVEVFDREKKENGDFLSRTVQAEAEVHELEEKKQEEKLRLSKIESEPEVARRKRMVVKRAYTSRDEEFKKLQENEAVLDRQLEELQSQKTVLEQTTCDVRLRINSYESDISICKEDEEEYVSRIKSIKLDIETQHERKLEHDEEESDLIFKYNRAKDKLTSLEKERDRVARSTLKLQSSIENVETQQHDLRNQLDGVHNELTAVERQRKKAASEMRELYEDVEIVLRNTLEQSDHDEATTRRLRESESNLKALETQIAELSSQERELFKLLEEKTRERERMARYSARALQKRRNTIDEVQLKDATITELLREQGQFEAMIEEVHEKFIQVRREKNNYQKNIQAYEQRLAEIKEKNKIIENELEVLNKESFSKDKDMAASRRARAKIIKEKESYRTEVDKSRALLKEKIQMIKEQDAEVERQNAVINRLEDEMLKLKKKYEQSVEDRNYTGIQLIDRNDELCILYEKSNLQESIGTEGEIALRKREDEIRMLTIELKDIQRELDVCQHLIPEIEESQSQILDLQTEIQYERQMSDFLVEQLETTENKDRWRRLEGQDSRPEELRRKVVKLEHRLNQKKEQVLEKNLLLDQLTRASDKIRSKALDERDATLDVAKEMNSYQARLRKTTKAMMATVAELSMYQATAMKLEAERREKEEVLRTAVERLDQGEEPVEGLDEELFQMEQARAQYAELMQRRHEEMQQQRDRPATLTRTTAEPRPNAYVPDDDLGIPKPYSGLAPFKPSESGSSMRFIRKPVPREIEL